MPRLIAGSLAAAAAALAQPAGSQSLDQPAAEAVEVSRTFQPRDVFALSQALDAEISPDGHTVAYTRATGDIMIDGFRREIWLVDLATGRQRPLGVPGSTRPRWSPDGQRLAFVAKPDGEGIKAQVLVHYLENGANAALAPVSELPSDLAWSPDGRSIGFVMFVPGEGAKLGTPFPKPEGAKWAAPVKVIDQVHFREDGEGYLRPGYAHLFVVSADGGAPRQLTSGTYDDRGSLSWTADGRSIVFSSNHNEDRSEIGSTLTCSRWRWPHAPCAS